MSKNASPNNMPTFQVSSIFIHVSLNVRESLCSFIDIKFRKFERTINYIKVHNILNTIVLQS